MTRDQIYLLITLIIALAFAVPTIVQLWLLYCGYYIYDSNKAVVAFELSLAVIATIILCGGLAAWIRWVRRGK